MKKFLFLFLFSAMFYIVKAQDIEREVIASATSSMENGTLLLNATLGETVIATLEGSNALSVSSGFHQADLIFTNTYEPFSDLDVQVFPNPTSSSIRISTSSKDDVTVVVYNLMGQALLQKELMAPIEQAALSLDELPAAHYFLKITDKTGNPIFITSLQKIN